VPIRLRLRLLGSSEVMPGVFSVGTMRETCIRSLKTFYALVEIVGRIGRTR
jgi:hypothetical protein